MKSGDAQQVAIESELAAMLGKIIQESGNPVGFGANEWVTGCLKNLNPALDGRSSNSFQTSGRRRFGCNSDLRIPSGSFS